MFSSYSLPQALNQLARSTGVSSLSFPEGFNGSVWPKELIMQLYRLYPLQMGRINATGLNALKGLRDIMNGVSEAQWILTVAPQIVSNLEWKETVDKAQAYIKPVLQSTVGDDIAVQEWFQLVQKIPQLLRTPGKKNGAYRIRDDPLPVDNILTAWIQQLVTERASLGIALLSTQPMPGVICVDASRKIVRVLIGSKTSVCMGEVCTLMDMPAFIQRMQQLVPGFQIQPMEMSDKFSMIQAALFAMSCLLDLPVQQVTQNQSLWQSFKTNFFISNLAALPPAPMGQLQAYNAATPTNVYMNQPGYLPLWGNQVFNQGTPGAWNPAMPGQGWYQAPTNKNGQVQVPTGMPGIPYQQAPSIPAGQSANLFGQISRLVPQNINQPIDYSKYMQERQDQAVQQELYQTVKDTLKNVMNEPVPQVSQVPPVPVPLAASAQVQVQAPVAPPLPTVPPLPVPLPGTIQPTMPPSELMQKSIPSPQAVQSIILKTHQDVMDAKVMLNDVFQPFYFPMNTDEYNSKYAELPDMFNVYSLQPVQLQQLVRNDDYFVDYVVLVRVLNQYIVSRKSKLQWVQVVLFSLDCMLKTVTMLDPMPVHELVLLFLINETISAALQWEELALQLPLDMLDWARKIQKVYYLKMQYNPTDEEKAIIAKSNELLATAFNRYSSAWNRAYSSTS